MRPITSSSTGPASWLYTALLAEHVTVELLQISACPRLDSGRPDFSCRALGIASSKPFSGKLQSLHAQSRSCLTEARLAQSAERKAPNLVVVGRPGFSCQTLGIASSRHFVRKMALALPRQLLDEADNFQLCWQSYMRLCWQSYITCPWLDSGQPDFS